MKNYFNTRQNLIDKGFWKEDKKMAQFFDTETENAVRSAISYYGPYNFLEMLTKTMTDMAQRKQLAKGGDYFAWTKGAQNGVFENALCENMSRAIKANVLPMFADLIPPDEN